MDDKTFKYWWKSLSLENYFFPVDGISTFPMENIGTRNNSVNGYVFFNFSKSSNMQYSEGCGTYNFPNLSKKQDILELIYIDFTIINIMFVTFYVTTLKKKRCLVSGENWVKILRENLGNILMENWGHFLGKTLYPWPWKK